MALISQSNRQDFPTRPTDQELTWERIYLERRARDARRYRHREDVYPDSGAVAATPKRFLGGEPSGVAPAPDVIPKASKRRKPTAERSRALREMAEATMRPKRRYRRNTT